VVIKCPKDGVELDPGEWTQCSFGLPPDDRSVYVWDRCPGSPDGQRGHRVTVVWIGRRPEVVVTEIVAVPPPKSYVPNRGLSPSPFKPKPGVQRMNVIKVPRKEV
jgi:hypothetical protein